MAEIIEVRRHSLRGEGKSLSPEGIALARRAADTLVGNYQAAYTSPKPRCIETLEAFGFDVWKLVPEFGTLPKRIDDHEEHVEALQNRTQCTWLEACMAIPATHLIVEQFGNTLFDKIRELADGLHAGKNALAVSHGGSIEAAVLAAMPEWDFDDLGGELALCEAACFHFDHGLFRRIEFIRL